MKIIFIGDITGRPGRRAIRELVPELRAEFKPDLIIANGENMAAGAGLTVPTYQEVLENGVDFLTSGDHIWDKTDIFPILETKSEKLIRPANYPERDPGRGYEDVAVGKNRVRIINLMGNVFMRANLVSPFVLVDHILSTPDCPKIVLIDFHAEATSEKIAFSYYVDGRVSAVLGTHTHVQTNDARILAGGTAALTDVGMTGPADGVIGADKQVIVESYLTQMPWKYEIADGSVELSAVYLELDESTGKATKIELIKKQLKATEQASLAD